MPFDGGGWHVKTDEIEVEGAVGAPPRDAPIDEKIAWLDAYHARVREELRPLMGEHAAWLDQATEPLA